MKRKLLQVRKMLLVAAGLLVGASAWADGAYYQVWTNDFETEANLKTGWSYSADANLTHTWATNPTLGNHYYHIWTENGKNRTCTYTLTSQSDYFASATDYIFEMDFSQYNSNNSGNTTTFQIVGANDNVLLNIACKDWATKATATVGEKTVELDMDAMDSNTRGSINCNIWYHFTVAANSENGTTVKIEKWTSSSEKTIVLDATQASTEMITLQNVNVKTGSYTQVGFDNFALSTYSEQEVVAAPTSSITGVSGTSRFVTIVQNDAASIWYNTDGGESYTQYTEPIEITAISTTIYYYAQSASGAKSDVVSETYAAGTEVQLIAPTIARTTATTIVITASQADVLCKPTATIYYTYGEDSGSFTGSKTLTISDEGVITAYAVADGYTNSEESNRSVALFPTNLLQVENANYSNSYTTGELGEELKTTGKATYAPLLLDGKQWSNNVYFQTSNWGFRNNGRWYVNTTSNNTSAWILMESMKTDDIIVIKSSYAPSSLVNVTYFEKYSYDGMFAYIVDTDGDVEFGLNKVGGNMNYLDGVYAYSNYASITIASSGYSTLASACGLDFSDVDGLTAYVVTEITSDAVKLEEVNEVPANTGVILKGTGDASYSIPVKADATFNDTNLLQAAVTATEIGANEAYILQGGEFHLVTKASTVPAGKAYLEVPAGARILSFLFGGETTGIAEVATAGAENGAIYNLSGQRISKPANGLYIMNGKKVIIK